MASDDSGESFAHSRDSTLVNSPLFFDTSHNRSLSNTSARSNATVMSNPFQYADDLETPSDTLLNFYLDSANPNPPDPSQVKAPHKPLLRYIKQTDLNPTFKNGIISVVTCIVEMGDLLFPPTYLLNEEVRKRVSQLADYVGDYTTSVIDHLKWRIEQTYQAFRRLPNPCVTDSEELALSIAKWTEILE